MKHLILFLISLSLCTAIVDVTGLIDWSNTTNVKISRLSFGLDAFYCFDPAVAGTPGNQIYKTNVALMNPGLIRCYNPEQMDDSKRNPNGWVMEPDTKNYRWDAEKISQAFAGAYSYGPEIILNIEGWPEFLDDGTGKLKKEFYDDYTNFVLDLVKIVNVQLKKNITRWELFSGKDEEYSILMEELGRIYATVASAIRKFDPKLKIGGIGFQYPEDIVKVDQFLSTAFQDLDFMSWKYYSESGNTSTNAALWDSAMKSGTVTAIVRSNLSKYRATSEVEFFQDEWNLSTDPSDIRMRNNIGVVYDALELIYVARAGATSSLARSEAGINFGKLDKNFGRRDSSWVWELFNANLVGNAVYSSSSNDRDVVLFATKNTTSGSYSFVAVNRSGQDVNLKVTPKGLPEGRGSFKVTAITDHGISSGSVNVASLGTTGIRLVTNAVAVFALSS